MVEEAHIKELVEQAIEGTDLFIVDVQVHPTDRIFIEIDRMGDVTIDHCVKVNEWLKERLDDEGEVYELNVSSPGLDEPFKVREQYKKNVGNEVSILTRNGQRFKGILQEVGDEGILIMNQKKEKVKGKKKKVLVEKEHSFDYDDLKETKVVISF